MPATRGARMETNINLKYHLGTFEGSIHSAIIETKRIKKKIAEKIKESKVAK